MHLVELLSLRAMPAAGISLGLTRRCPLSCAHCSTNSTRTSEQHPAALFRRFVASFTIADRPEVLAMSGGEPLLRPHLVHELAELAREVGTRSTVLTGLFFATKSRIPRQIREAIAALDHLSVSLDAFHEQEVPRTSVLRVLEEVQSGGTDVSLHLVGRDADDPYLEAVTVEVMRVFSGQVPMLVNRIGHFGRARTWHLPDRLVPPAIIEAEPCAMAAWPVVGFDGTVIACGNDDALDKRPAHLVLGHAATDDWTTIRARALASPTLRALRVFGPQYLTMRHGGGCGSGYCATCLALPEDDGFAKQVAAVMAKPSTAVLETEVAALQRQAGAVVFARRHGVPRYANLVTLGAPA